MPYLTLDPNCDLYYGDNEYTPPWEEREVAELVYGVAEHHGVWFDWIPRFAPHYRLIRLDLRDFGASRVPPPTYAVSVTLDFLRQLNT